MLSDHIGKELFPECGALQVIGRLAFPVFAYMIAEGCYYTKNRKKYFLSIFLLGAGCQTVYFIVEQSFYQNILITFSLSVILIFVTENYKEKGTKKSQILFCVTLLLVLLCAILLPLLLKNQGFAIDYGVYGVLLPVAVFYAENKEKKLLWATIILIMLSYNMGGLQWASLLSVPLLALYNQKRGKYNIKLLFYIFYPAHLAVIYLISVLINS